MKRLLIVCLLAFLQSVSSFATTASGTLKNNSGVVVPLGKLELDLTNCPTPVLINGHGTPVSTYSLSADSRGALTPLFVTGNDQITCGGVINHTYYLATARDVNGNVLWTRSYQFTGNTWIADTAQVLNPIPSTYFSTNWGSVTGNIQTQTDLIHLIATIEAGGFTVNSATVDQANFNGTVPAADMNYVACAFKVSDPNVISQCPIGTTGSSFAAGNDARITGAQQTSAKDAANGYAGLDGSGLLNPAEAPTWNQSTTGNSATTTRLAGTPSQCPGGQAPTGIQANGNANGCQSVSGGGGGMINPMTALGDTIYGGNSGVPSALSGNTTTTRHLMIQVGNGFTSLAPFWDVLQTSDIPVITESQVNSLTSDLAAKEVSANKDTANGYAGLDGSGKLKTGEAPTWNQSTTGNAATATALATAPTECSSGQATTGVDAHGNAQNCTPITVGMTNPMTNVGDTLYGGTSGTPTRLPGNTSATRKFVIEQGTGSSAQAPIVDVLASGDIPNIVESQVTSLSSDLAAKEVTANKDVANGYAGLDSGGKLKTAEAPTWNQNTTGTASGLSTSIAESQVTNLTTDLAAKQATSAKDAANGYAGLDGSGKLQTSEAPTWNQGTSGNAATATALAAAPAQCPSGDAPTGVDTQGNAQGCQSLTASGMTNPMTAVGDTIYGGTSGSPTRLAGNTSATRKFVVELGTGSAAQAPIVDVLASGDIPNIAESQVTNLTTDLAAKEVTANKDAASGYAGLDGSSKLKTAEAPTWNQSTTGNAATATQLAASPTLCSTGNAPTGVDAHGNAVACASITGGGLSNPMTAVGDTIYGGTSGSPTRLAGNTSATRKFYLSQGTGSVAQAPIIDVIASGDIPNLAESQITSLTTDLAAKEVTANKDVASGYAGLDSGGKLKTSEAPIWNQSTTGTAAGLSSNIAESQVTSLTTDLSAKEVTANKDANNGYAGLDSSGKLKTAEAPTWNQSTTGTAGGLSSNIAESQVTNLSTDLAAKEVTANKDANSGYAGLDSGGKLKTAEAPTWNQNTTGYASILNSFSSDPSSPASWTHGCNTTFGLCEYYDGTAFQRLVTQAEMPIPQAPQVSGMGASIGAAHWWSSVFNLVFFGDSHYAGILGTSPVLTYTENAVAILRNKLQAAHNDAGPGFVSACNGVADITCNKHPDPPGNTITNNGTAWSHELQLASGGTGTPFGLDSSDIYNTTSGSGSLTFKCQYCSEMLVFFKNITGEGTFTCTIDGSATGACSGTVNAATLSNPWIDSGSLSYVGTHTIVVTLASGVIHNAGYYGYVASKKGVIVTNLAMGSAGATQNAYPFVNFATQANAMLTQINPSAIVIGATGSNECVQGTSVATFATNLHTLYTTLQGIVGANVPILFATGPDEVPGSGCTTLAQYEQAIRNEALADGTRVIDVNARYSPYSKVRTMLPGGTTCYASIEPHLNNSCADDVADMFVKLLPQSTRAQSLGHSVGFGDWGPLATWKQTTGLTQYELLYNNGGLATPVPTSATSLSPSLLLGSCIGNCGTLAADADYCNTSACEMIFDSGGGTVGHTVIVSTATGGDVADSGASTDPSSCLLVVGSIKSPPPSGGGFGVVDMSHPHLTSACGSGGGSSWATLTPGTLTQSTSSVYGFGTDTHLDLDAGCDPGTCLKLPMDTAQFAINPGYMSWDSNTGVNQVLIGRGVSNPFRIPFTSYTQPASGNCANWQNGSGQIGDALEPCQWVTTLQNTSFTLDCTYVGKLVYNSLTTTPTWTLPTSICPAQTTIALMNYGTANVTVSTSINVNGSAAGWTLAGGCWTTLVSDGSTWKALRYDSTNGCGGGGAGVSSLAATSPLHVSGSTGAVTASLQNSLGVAVTNVPDVKGQDITVNLTSLGTGCASTVTLASPASDTFYTVTAQLAQTVAYTGTGTHGAVAGQLTWTDAKTSASMGAVNNIFWEGSQATSWGTGPATSKTAASSIGNTTVFYGYIPPAFVKGGTILTFCANVSTASTDTVGGTFVYSVRATQY